MKKEQRNSIATYYLRFILLSTLTVAVVLIIFFVLQSFSFFRKVAEQTRTRYVETQKEMIKQEVDQAVSLVRHEKSKMETGMRELLRERVNRAYAIAASIYENFSGRYPRKTVAKMIKEALRPLRFDGGEGYVFIGSLKGYEELYPVSPEWEGKYVWDLQDSHGNFVMHDEVKAVEEKGEGFVEAYWRKPGGKDKMAERKTTFVKLFKPLGWYIGTGIYEEDYKKETQDNILSLLEQIRYGNDDILFGATWEGVSILGPKAAEGKNMLDTTDVNGVKIVEELIRLAKQGGGYLEYVMPKALSRRPLPKISYVRGIPDWQWYIGASFYKTDIEGLIARQENMLKKSLGSGLVQAGIILLVLALSLLLLSRYMYKNISAHFDNFLSFLHLAATEFVFINLPSIKFNEFHSLGTAANQMIKERNIIEEKLQKTHKELNILMENSPDFINTIEQDGTITYTNRKLSEKRREIVGRSILEFVALAYKETFRSTLETVFTDHGQKELQILSEDGAWFLCRFIPILFENDLYKVMVISSDITETKKSESTIRESLKEKEVLLREIHHRVKNNLQIISSMLNLQLYSLRQEQDPSIFVDCKNRITTMALIHEQLYRSDKLSEIDMEEYITDLVWSIRDSHPNAGKEIQVEFDIEELKFDLDTAIPCGLIIHELVSNSVKYAFPGGTDGGMIRVLLHRKEKDTFLLTISDNGKGIPEGEDIFTRDTLGIQLVNALTQQLNGSYRVETRGGVSWEILFSSTE